MEIKEKIVGLIKKAVAGLKIKTDETIELEHPADPKFGDYSCNIALKLKQNPKQVAEKIINLIKDNKDFESITVAGPGFINFKLSEGYLLDQLNLILSQKRYDFNNIGQNKKVIVEYSSPNIAKPFTIGHLRSSIIGDSIANILESSGFKVYRDNHLGDWGTQFGKQIYAIKTWGNEKKIDSSDNPVEELVNLYVKFHQEAEKDPQIEEEGRKWFKKLEDGDKEARRLWEKCINWSWVEFNQIYKKLNLKFTENNGRGYGESFFENKLQDLVDEIDSKKLLTDSKGAKLVFFQDDKYPPLMIIKKDGATLYSTRDLATDKFRLQNYGSDIKIINEVGAEQALYFKQIFETEKLLGWFKNGQRVHVGHGMYRFKDKKMSTRKGNVIWLSDVLNKAFAKARKVASHNSEKTTWAVAVGALKWNDLKRSAALDVVFDWDELLNLQGNSGPYIQYVYARCQSVLANKKTDLITSKELNKEEIEVLRLMTQFNEIVELAAKELAPHHICTYLYKLSQSFNSLYNLHRIKDNQTRLNITSAVSLIIKDGLSLLGIDVVEKM